MDVDKWIQLGLLAVTLFVAIGGGLFKITVILKKDREDRSKGMAEMFADKLEGLETFLKLQERVKVLEITGENYQISFKDELKEIKSMINRLFAKVDEHIIREKHV